MPCSAASSCASCQSGETSMRSTRCPQASHCDEARLARSAELLREERPARELAEVDELRLDLGEHVRRAGPREVLAEEGVRLVGVREPGGSWKKAISSRITGRPARRDEAVGGAETPR